MSKLDAFEVRTSSYELTQVAPTMVHPTRLPPTASVINTHALVSQPSVVIQCLNSAREYPDETSRRVGRPRSICRILDVEPLVVDVLGAGTTLTSSTGSVLALGSGVGSGLGSAAGVEIADFAASSAVVAGRATPP